MPGTLPLNGRTLQVLAPEDVERIHGASLDLLEQVGMVFEDDAAVALLSAHGARIDDGRVHLPARLVEEALATCPKRISLPARNPARDLELGQGRVHFTSGYGATFVRDLESDTVRPATLDDVRQLAVLADALECAHYCLLPVLPQDLPPEKAELAGAAVMLATTSKHFGPSLPTMRYYPTLIELARLASGERGKLGISLGATTTSPLKLSGDTIARLRLCAEEHVPFRIVSAPMSGVNAPATLAGTLALQNAEVLAGIVLGQLISPGAPLIYGTFAAAGDMRTAKIALGAPELPLLNAASAQLSRRYGVPLGYGTGGTCDSPRPDEQAGAERMLTMVLAAAAGVDAIHDAVGGLLGSAMCAGAAQMVVDNELCRMAERAIRGIEVSPETLALDVIAAVGPGGSFLAEEHTVRHWRGEHFVPRLLDRSWVADPVPGPALYERARDEARRLLATHRAEAVDERTRAAMERLLRSAGVDVHL